MLILRFHSVVQVNVSSEHLEVRDDVRTQLLVSPLNIILREKLDSPHLPVYINFRIANFVFEILVCL